MKSLIRYSIITCAASVFFFSMPITTTGQAPTSSTKNIVLVHGAFADGSSWSKVIPLLQAKGFNVIAVQNPLTSLKDDVAATQRALALMDGPVLLVGHSWGGMVITEAGIDPKVAGLVYIAALIPDEGQSVVDVVAAFPPAPGSGEFKADASGFLSLSEKGIHEYFAQDLPAAKRKMLFVTQVQWAASATAEPVTKIAWKTKPSWSIVATEDQTINPELERAEAKMIKATTLELKSSHVPMLSHAKKVADFIAAAAAQTSDMQSIAQLE